MTVVAGCGGGVARVAPVRTAAAVGVTSTETEKNMNINYSTSITFLKTNANADYASIILAEKSKN